MAPACQHISSSRHAITELKKAFGKDISRCASCWREEREALCNRQSEAIITRIKLELKQNPSSKPRHIELETIEGRLARISREVQGMYQRQHRMTHDSQATTKNEAQRSMDYRRENAKLCSKYLEEIKEELEKEEACLLKNSLAELYQEDINSLRSLAHSTSKQCRSVLRAISDCASYVPSEQGNDGRAGTPLLSLHYYYIRLTPLFKLQIPVQLRLPLRFWQLVLWLLCDKTQNGIFKCM